MEQLDVNISIIYDEDKKEIIQAEIRGEHTLGEIPVIIGGLQRVINKLRFEEIKKKKIR